MKIRIYFIILLFIVPIISSYSQDLEDIISELQEELQLNDDQAEQLSAALVKYSQEMNTELAKHEDAEEPDTKAMIGDIKKAQESPFASAGKKSFGGLALVFKKTVSRFDKVKVSV